MAISASNLTNTFNNTAASSYNTASITPGANHLILVSVFNFSSTSGNAVAPTLSGNGMTWVQVGTQTDGTTQRTASLFRGQASSPTPGAITISFSVSQTRVAWSVDDFSGTIVDTANNGNAAVIQSQTGSVSGSNSSFTITLVNPLASPLNASYGNMRQSGAAGAATEGSGFTRLSNQNDATNTANYDSEYAINLGNPNWTFASSTGNIVGVACEVAALQLPVIFVEDINVYRLHPRLINPLSWQTSPVMGFLTGTPTPKLLFPNPDDRYFPPKRESGAVIFVEFPFAPAKTPTTLPPNPDDRFWPLKREEGKIAWDAQFIAAAFTPNGFANPDDRFFPPRRVDGNIVFVEFPFAPAKTPTAFTPNPDDRFWPLRRVDGNIWNPTIYGLPAATPNYLFPNPDDKFFPPRRVDGAITQGWQPVLTPARNPYLPDDRFFPARRVDGAITQGWQPVLTPGPFIPNPDDRYFPPRREAGAVVFVEFPFAPAPTPTAFTPNPDDRFWPARRVEGTISNPAQLLVGYLQQPVLLPDDPRYWPKSPVRSYEGQVAEPIFVPVIVPVTLVKNPDDSYFPPRREIGSVIFVPFPGAPAPTPSTALLLPDDPRYIPIRRVDGDMSHAEIMPPFPSKLIIIGIPYYGICPAADQILLINQLVQELNALNLVPTQLPYITQTSWNWYSDLFTTLNQIILQVNNIFGTSIPLYGTVDISNLNNDLNILVQELNAALNSIY